MAVAVTQSGAAKRAAEALQEMTVKFIWLKVLLTVAIFAGLFGWVYYKVAHGGI
jgi:hypothetical protein